MIFGIALTGTFLHYSSRQNARGKRRQEDIDQGKLVEEDLDPEVLRLKTVVQRELNKAKSK